LSEPEFILAMWMIYGKLKGMEIPDTLPETIKSELGLTNQALVVSPQAPPKKVVGNYEVNLDDIVPTPVATPVLPVNTPGEKNMLLEIHIFL
jgi:hypothetical protein